MKEARWEKKKFLGTELRGKTLGSRAWAASARKSRFAPGHSDAAHRTRSLYLQGSAAGLNVELMTLDDMRRRRLSHAAPALDRRDASRVQ